MAGTKVAVLDDYQEVSKPHFDQLRDAGYEVDVFSDTLLPYNHPDTPQDVKDALVKRLEPYKIISRRHTVALILGLARNLAADDAAVKAGAWQTRLNTGLSGKTFGTVGLGRLGAAVARIMHLAFGMKIAAWSANLTQEAADDKARAMGLPVEDAATGAKTFRAVSRDELFAGSDVVSIHVVLSERSRGLVAKDDLAKMKKSALFVNTSRGPIVNERDLLEAGKRGAVRGIAMDVYNIEPLPTDSEWRTTKWGEDGRSDVLLTPHMGYVEGDPLSGWYKQQVENILRWDKGEELKVQYKDNGY
ncbi:hypothetical protein KJ359_004731 [Pestalotiopsis sp. 9143b]|nr:hypothetical protein KJ359_004731 [Pestalotiopsis sp. 9143b]